MESGFPTILNHRTPGRPETACSGASSWSSPWIVTRWPVRHLVVTHHVSLCAH